MNLKDVKAMMNRVVYYDTGQINFDGCTIKDFILTACILRKDRKKGFFYQAELKESNCNSVIIVPLENVLLKNEV